MVLTISLLCPYRWGGPGCSRGIRGLTGRLRTLLTPPGAALFTVSATHSSRSQTANMTLPTRKLGDVDVSALGFGAMGISAFYGPTEPDEERFKVGGPYIHPGSRLAPMDFT